MTDIVDTVQLQETGDSLVELFEITLPHPISTTVYLTNGLDEGSENLYFGSSPTTADPTGGAVLREYIAIPIELKGIEFNASGASNRPTLSIANLVTLGRTIANDADGTDDETTFDSILQSNDITSNTDVLGATVVYRTTLASKLSKASDVSGYSPATPIEFPSQTYVLERVSGENNLLVTFELTSPFDIEKVKVPGRIVVAQYCPWEYQGNKRDRPGGCSWDLNSNGRFFDVNDNIITKDTDSTGAPNTSSGILIHSISTSYSAGAKAFTKHTTTSSNDTIQIWKAKIAHSNKPPLDSSNNPINKVYWERIDFCGKTLNSCKIRYQGNNSDTTLNEGVPLPFGAFPGVAKFQ